MKKATVQKHKKIVNGIMHYIYKYIDTHITLDELSEMTRTSKYHMLRIFREEFGENIYETIKETRLKKASTLLLTNKNSTITDVAKMCGYTSHGAFIRVFKQRFGMTPTAWRTGGYQNFLHFSKAGAFTKSKPRIVKFGGKRVSYIRHKGYDDSLHDVWVKLESWLLVNGTSEYERIGFYHDIPLITPPQKCKHTAGVIVKSELPGGPFPEFEMPEGVYAKFAFKGTHEAFLEFINRIHFIWLIESGYETTPEPSFAIFHNNPFAQKEGVFEADYYLSITL